LDILLLGRKAGNIYRRKLNIFLGAKKPDDQRYTLEEDVEKAVEVKRGKKHSIHSLHLKSRILCGPKIDKVDQGVGL
jgi:hypothetical protein